MKMKSQVVNRLDQVVMTTTTATITPSIGIQEKGSLLSLMSEPSRLKEEASRLNNELEVLVMDNYRVFIENLTCSINLKKQVYINFIITIIN